MQKQITIAKNAGNNVCLHQRPPSNVPSTPPSKHEIVDCGTFYEVTFFCISPKNLLGDFFYSLNEEAHREPGLSAIRWSRLLCHALIIPWF